MVDGETRKLTTGGLVLYKWSMDSPAIINNTNVWGNVDSYSQSPSIQASSTLSYVDIGQIGNKLLFCYTWVNNSSGYEYYSRSFLKESNGGIYNITTNDYTDFSWTENSWKDSGSSSSAYGMVQPRPVYSTTNEEVALTRRAILDFKHKRKYTFTSTNETFAGFSDIDIYAYTNENYIIAYCNYYVPSEYALNRRAMIIDRTTGTKNVNSSFPDGDSFIGEKNNYAYFGINKYGSGNSVYITVISLPSNGVSNIDIYTDLQKMTGAPTEAKAIYCDGEYIYVALFKDGSRCKKAVKFKMDGMTTIVWEGTAELSSSDWVVDSKVTSVYNATTFYYLATIGDYAYYLNYSRPYMKYPMFKLNTKSLEFSYVESPGIMTPEIFSGNRDTRAYCFGIQKNEYHIKGISNVLAIGANGILTLDGLLPLVNYNASIGALNTNDENVYRLRTISRPNGAFTSSDDIVFVNGDYPKKLIRLKDLMIVPATSLSV